MSGIIIKTIILISIVIIIIIIIDILIICNNKRCLTTLSWERLLIGEWHHHQNNHHCHHRYHQSLRWKVLLCKYLGTSFLGEIFDRTQLVLFFRFAVKLKRKNKICLFWPRQIYLEYLGAVKMRDKDEISMWYIWMWIKWETKFRNSYGPLSVGLNP